MLKEEAHHMFVGAAGIGRVVQRTVELMKEHDTDDVREHGGIDVPTLQRYLNFHYSVSLDLFGAETSSNAANYFASGLKGRFQEERRDDDHRLHDATRSVPAIVDGAVGAREVPALSALNETLRDDYVADCAKGVDRWNRMLDEVGASCSCRTSGSTAASERSASDTSNPEGDIVDDDMWAANVATWLPTADDEHFVRSLMQRVNEPGKMAGWIAPPAAGINGKPVDFEYVRDA